MGTIHDVYDSDTRFIINPITRLVKNESSRKTTLIQKDHNSERFSFEVPRYIEGHDMSLCNKVEINYINIDAAIKEQKNEGQYIVEDLQIDKENEEKVVFSWLISEQATQYAGLLSFNIMFRCMDNAETMYRWSTYINSDISVSGGYDNGNVIAQEYADVLAAWEKELFDAEDSAIKNIENKANSTMAAMDKFSTDTYNSFKNNVDAKNAAMTQHANETFENFNSSVDRKAEQTLASIPEEYSDLDAEVKMGKADILDAEQRLIHTDGIIDISKSFVHGMIKQDGDGYITQEVDNQHYHRIATKDSVYLMEGDIVTFPDLSLYNTYLYYIDSNGSYQIKFFGNGSEGQFVLPNGTDWLIMIESNKSTPIDDIIGVASALKIHRPSNLLERMDEAEEKLEQLGEGVEVLNEEVKYIDKSSKTEVANIFSEHYYTDSFRGRFAGFNGSVEIIDGWIKFKPNGNSSYGSVGYEFLTDYLDAGVYFLSFELKTETSIPISSVLVRMDDSIQGCLYNIPEGSHKYGSRTCYGIIKLSERSQYKAPQVYINYGVIPNPETDFVYVRKLTFLNITNMGLQDNQGYYLADILNAQCDGFVDDKSILDFNLHTLYPLQNRNFVLLGDSIFANYSVGSKLEYISHGNVANFADGGTTATGTGAFSTWKIAKGIGTGDWSEQEAANKTSKEEEILQLLKSYSFENADSLIILIGTNDWRRKVAIGENDSLDTNTFKGALNSIVADILTTYPNINIYFLTPLYRTEFGDVDTVPNDSGTYLYEYADAMIDIANKHKLPVFDTFREGGINSYNSTRYLADGTHPTMLMQIKLAQIINKMLEKYEI